MPGVALTHPSTLIPVRRRVEKHLSLKGKENGKLMERSNLEVQEWQLDCGGA